MSETMSCVDIAASLPPALSLCMFQCVVHRYVLMPLHFVRKLISYINSYYVDLYFIRKKRSTIDRSMVCVCILSENRAPSSICMQINGEFCAWEMSEIRVLYQFPSWHGRDMIMPRKLILTATHSPLVEVINSIWNYFNRFCFRFYILFKIT